MNNDAIYNLLEAIGLHKNEARLYLTALKLGPASAIQLGQKMDDTRQMVYLLLPGMMGKGLIKKIALGNKDYYKAVEPDILADIAQKNKEKVLKIMPVLKSQASAERAIPLITVYENPLAMREWYRQYMKGAKKGDEILIWSTGNVEYWYGMDKEFYDKYLAFNDKTGVKTYLILPDTKAAQKHREIVGRPHILYKPYKNAWRANAEKWVWRDQICYLTIRENATNMIVIESKELAEIERFDFWTLWRKK